MNRRRSAVVAIALGGVGLIISACSGRNVGAVPPAQTDDAGTVSPAQTDDAGAVSSDAAPSDGLVAPCSPGLLACVNECVDPVTDPRNCGACGARCPAAHVCASGTCEVSCPAGTADCDGACVIVAHHPKHCGSCEVSCGVEESCVDGECRPLAVDAIVCSSPARTCSGTCIDVTSDSAHCGACDARCPADRECVASACNCVGGKASCASRCVDLALDRANCGACGTTCGPLETCEASTCVCAPSASRCDGSCTNTNIDPKHCGGCGTACAGGEMCTAGSCHPPSSDWMTFQGNAQHTGENAVETAVPPATTQWTVRVGPTDAYGNPRGVKGVAVSRGRVFATIAGRHLPHLPVTALSASNGAMLWSHNFGSVSSAGWPSADGDSVYVQQGTGLNYVEPRIWAFDAATGAVRWQSVFRSQWSEFLPPIVVGERIFFHGGYYGGLYGVTRADATPVFFSGALSSYDRWSPGYSNGIVYSLAGRRLSAHHEDSGNVLWTWDSPSAGIAVDTAPVLAGGRAFVGIAPALHCVDLATHAPVWTANGGYGIAPAVTGTTVLAIDDGKLRAHDAATGELLWSFTGDGALAYPPVVAAGHVYVASDAHVHAVSLATHESVWSAETGGWLAVAAGRLFVSSRSGDLTGFVLTR
ncbi:MAG: PQQ-binding-like beta-propeller repeat protein [Labilithrix sp.]|nr:PQQ-binding-like beta-propeller repeat protein [Labilithrix sp.]